MHSVASYYNFALNFKTLNMARKYVHHNKKERPRSLSFYLGSVNDSFDYLKQLCNDKSVELLKTIEVNEDNTIDVVFWTDDFSNLKEI